VRVGITRPHHLATIFENLHVTNPGNLPKRGVLLDPTIHDPAQFLEAHSWNGQIVTRRKTHHAADALLCLSNEQATGIEVERRELRQHRRVIVVKNVGLRIRGRLRSSCAPISGTQVTVGIERSCGRRLKLLYSSQPRTLGPMRRDENPFPQERIESPVWNSI
jgi:hypothetical protein